MATGRKPTEPNELPPASCVRFVARDGKERRGVVLRVHPLGSNPVAREEELLVVAGTSVEPLARHGEQYVKVEPRTPGGTVLRLDTITWFKSSMIEVIPRSKARGTGQRVPPGLLHKLEGLIPFRAP